MYVYVMFRLLFYQLFYVYFAMRTDYCEQK